MARKVAAYNSQLQYLQALRKRSFVQEQTYQEHIRLLVSLQLMDRKIRRQHTIFMPATRRSCPEIQVQIYRQRNSN